MKIKRNKGALNVERKKLALYRKVLQPLELKRMQLSLELKKVRRQAESLERVLREQIDEQSRAMPMIAACKHEDMPVPRITAVRTRKQNIVGVNVTVLEAVEFEASTYDLFMVPVWQEIACERMRRLMKLQVERNLLDEQMAKLKVGLKKTTQRINLFEKVLIPKSVETIRIIRIALDEMQRSAVIRSKLAKRKHHGRANG